MNEDLIDVKELLEHYREENVAQAIKECLTKINDYQREALEAIKKGVLETHPETGTPDIHTTLLSKKDLEKSNVYQAILPDQNVSEQKILSKVRQQSLFTYATCFLKLSYDQILELIESNPVFEGEIVADDGSRYRIQLKLIHNDRYKALEEELSEVFRKNRRPWQTLYSPFVRKMFDLHIVCYLDDTSRIQGIREIIPDFKEYQAFVLRNYYPVWNIKKEEIPCSSRGEMIIPYEGVLFYRYAINLEQNDVLVDCEEIEISHVQREGKTLRLFTREGVKKPRNFILYTFNPVTANAALAPVNEGRRASMAEPILSNALKKNWAVHLNPSYKPRTRAEITKLIYSYETLENLELLDLEILDSPGFLGHADTDNSAKSEGDAKGTNSAESEKSAALTYECNFFRHNEIVPKHGREKLLLTFRAAQDSYLTRDQLSFAVSVVQLYFPELICCGALV